MITAEIRKRASSYHRKVVEISSSFLTIKLCMRQRNEVSVSIYTRISTNVIEGLGGISVRIVGIKATKAIISAAMDAIRSARLLSWKNIPRLMIPNSQRGKKIVATVTVGNLYNGIVK